jgi:hypothetical protein
VEGRVLFDDLPGREYLVDVDKGGINMEHNIVDNYPHNHNYGHGMEIWTLLDWITGIQRRVLRTRT